MPCFFPCAVRAHHAHPWPMTFLLCGITIVRLFASIACSVRHFARQPDANPQAHYVLSSKTLFSAFYKSGSTHL